MPWWLWEWCKRVKLWLFMEVKMIQHSDWQDEVDERKRESEVDKSLAQVSGRIDLVLIKVEGLNNKQV